MKIITQSYLSLLNSFLFLNRFSVSLKRLNNYFFKGFAYKSILNRFSVLINYITWSANHFPTSRCFLRFLGLRLLRVHVFQGPGPGFRSSHYIQWMYYSNTKEINYIIILLIYVNEWKNIKVQYNIELWRRCANVALFKTN